MHLASFCKGKGGGVGGWELARGLMGTKTYRLVYCAAGIKHFVTLPPMVVSLSNDDGDGNENGKKAIGLDKQNNNFARA